MGELTPKEHKERAEGALLRRHQALLFTRGMAGTRLTGLMELLDLMGDCKLAGAEAGEE